MVYRYSRAGSSVDSGCLVESGDSEGSIVGPGVTSGVNAGVGSAVGSVVTAGSDVELEWGGVATASSSSSTSAISSGSSRMTGPSYSSGTTTPSASIPFRASLAVAVGAHSPGDGTIR